MTEEWMDHNLGGFWSDDVREIASEFDVPRTTAASWERHIGDIEVLKETLGKNAPDFYLDLISRREWIPRDLEDCEEDWVEPLKRWCTRRRDGVYLVDDSERSDFRREHRGSGKQFMGTGSGWSAAALTDSSTKQSEEDTRRGINWTEELAALQEEFDRKEEWVKYEMRRVDTEWIGLTRELRKIEKKLIEIYRNHLENDSRQFQYKKDKIIELKRAFPYLRANKGLVVEATDSSYSYVNKFKYIPDEGVANRRAKGKLRDNVLERDDYACVSCGSKGNLQVHHIIPRDQGGENAKENLATLCPDCHYYAHGGGEPIDEDRYTTALWGTVEYEDQTEFWDEWIRQDFNERVSKGFTRADFHIDE